MLLILSQPHECCAQFKFTPSLSDINSMKYLILVWSLALTSCTSIQEQCQTEIWKENKRSSEQQCIDDKDSQSQFEAQRNDQLGNAFQGKSQSMQQQQANQYRGIAASQTAVAVDFECLDECESKDRSYQLCKKQCSY